MKNEKFRIDFLKILRRFVPKKYFIEIFSDGCDAKLFVSFKLN